MRSKKPKLVKLVGTVGPATSVSMSGDQDSVSATEAARELNISSRSFRRLAEAGKIPSFRAPSGYVRVRRRDLDAYKSLSSSGVPAVPSRVDSGREEVQMLSLELQQRRLRRDLQRFEEEDAKIKREREEAVAAEQARSQAALEHVRRERAEREQREEEEWEKQGEIERRQDWVNGWVEAALNYLVPPEVSDRSALEIQSLVEHALQGLMPTSPKPIVERVVRAAVQQAVQPWQREQAIATAANAAIEQVRYGYWGNIEVENRAREQGLKAIAALPESASSDLMQAVARSAGRRVAQEQRDQEDREFAQQKREREVDTYLGDFVFPYLMELKDAPEPRGIVFADGEIFQCAQTIRTAIKPLLLQDRSLSWFSANQRVRQLVDDWLRDALNERPK